MNRHRRSKQKQESRSAHFSIDVCQCSATLWLMEYVGLADLVERWVYTRQGVHGLVRSKGFPAPVFEINKGRTKVWRLVDIEAYEKTHPEVLSEESKQRKIRWYARAISSMARR
jgi:hypothetical protein